MGVNNVVGGSSPAGERNGCLYIGERAAATEMKDINILARPTQGVNLIGNKDAMRWKLRSGPHVGDD